MIGVHDNPNAPPEVDYTYEESVPWACFLAAYALRLFTKTPKNNMVQSWNHMNTRYTGFFRSFSPIVMDVPENSCVLLKERGSQRGYGEQRLPRWQ